MSIEVTLERIAAALEKMAESDIQLAESISGRVISENGREAESPEEKPKTTRKKTTRKKAAAKKEETPAPQSAPAGEPEPAATTQEADQGTEPTEAAMTPAELNNGLMEIAKSVGPSSVTKIQAVLQEVGASNTAEVPEDKRAWVLEEAKRVVSSDG